MIIADVIGTGIFVTTGSVLGMTGNALTVLILWGIGGIVALTGSLCYAELATMWTESGGEYIYLKKTYGLLPSFLTGWISLIVGFSASIAISSMTLIWYFNEYFQMEILSGGWAQKICAAGIIFFFGILHIIGVKKGSLIQNGLTIIKLLIVLSLIGFGIYMADWNNAERLVMDYPASEGKSALDYGFTLLIIMFAYSGWNGTSYIAGEIKNPERNLPRSMFRGTLFIILLYLALNVIFIISAPGPALMGEKAVGIIAAENLFGKNISLIFTLGISMILLSCVSVQIMIGPRVYYAMAKDKIIFHSLSRLNPRFQTPDLAIIIQILIAVFYVFIGMDNVESLLGYMGFSLGIFPLLAVTGLVIMRYKSPDIHRPFKVPFFPITPIIYILLTLGMMIASLITWTKTSLFAIGVVGIGIVIFFIWKRFVR